MNASDVQLAGLDVSRETFAALKQYESLVLRWTSAINLISKSTQADVWQRHIVDSAQLFRHCPASARKWLDVGSGGGFPAIVIAILAREAKPDLHVTLVESDLRKATFLRQAVQILSLNATVLSARAESLSPMLADVLSARALAPLSDLLALAEMHLQPDGIAIFPKGARFGAEIASARQSWAFDVDTFPSLLEADAAILVIRDIHRARQV